MCMTKIRSGERIGQQGLLRVGASAAIFDPTRTKVLLTRRTDNGQWCFPAGAMDPGESIAETCVREVREETGLHVRIERLIGIYSSPNWLIEYADGNRFQVISVHFEATPTGGTLGVSSETTDYGYFSLAESEHLDLMEHHRERLVDTFAAAHEVVVR
jgi:8-oxo-dGTP pyrophosphatase MutT (NUDIX family)